MDQWGNVVAVTDPAGAGARAEYEVRPSGIVRSAAIDAGGARTVFDCDAAGRVVRVIDPAARVWTYELNVFGDVVAVTDPDGAVPTGSGDVLSQQVDHTTPSLPTLG